MRDMETARATSVAPARTRAAMENRFAIGGTAVETAGVTSIERNAAPMNGAAVESKDEKHSGILVFGGTAEGRQVSEYLAERKVAHTVCVATEYGVEAAGAAKTAPARTRAALENRFVNGSTAEEAARTISSASTHAAPEDHCAVSVSGMAVETGGTASLITIHQGRMDAEQMRVFLKEGEYALVVDATHPYAVEVSKNIREACGKENVRYLRYLRPQGNAEGNNIAIPGSDDEGENRGSKETGGRKADSARSLEAGNGKNCETVCVNSTKEAADYLEQQQGGIFLTTGSKELHVFTETVSNISRLFARVLPSAEVVTSCRALGLEGRQICAMQGPFSTEINVAMLRQTGASFLVTKSTGASGRFPEKIEAARQCGVISVIIRRPEESGFGWEEVKTRLDAWISAEADGETRPATAFEAAGGILPEIASEAAGGIQPKAADEPLKNPAAKLRSDLAVSCIGIGMGTPDTLTREALREMRESQVLFGAKRILESAREALRDESVSGRFVKEETLTDREISNDPAQAKALADKNALDRLKNHSQAAVPGTLPEMIPEYSAARIYDWLAAHPAYTKAAILMSGDAGFYSGARQVAESFPAEQVRYYCGISSVVYFASRISTTWQDAKLLSAHGKELALLNYVKKYPKIILLVSGASDVERFCGELAEAGLERVRVTVGTNLSYPEETIRSGSPDEFCSMDTTGLHILMIENPDAGGIITPGIPDEAFVRGKVPMTKEEIRALSVAKLRLREDSVVCDVGAGTGSVSIECARLCTEGSVFAIERNPEGIALIRENKRKFALSNLTAVEGTAPEALCELPAPTHAFIGGSSGNMREIIETLRGKNPAVRVVINTVTMETIAEVMDLIRELNIEDADIVQVSAAKSHPLGRYHMMTAHNPVYIIAFGGEGSFA